MDFPFAFTGKKIVNSLIIIAIIFSGYFIILVTSQSYETDTEYFLNILTFGSVSVGIIFLISGIISLRKKGVGFAADNYYFGLGLTGLIAVSSFFIFVIKILNISSFNLFYVLLSFTLFVIVASFLIAKIPKKKRRKKRR